MKAEYRRRLADGRCVHPYCPFRAGSRRVQCERHYQLDIAKSKRYSDLHPVQMMLARAKYRAAKRGVPFHLVVADVLIPEVCPVLGIPLRRGQGSHGGQDTSPSLDCFFPELGYVPGNVFVISNRANTIKNNATLQELERVTDWMRSHAQKQSG